MEVLGVDIGGTFTDYVLVTDGRLRLHKRLTSSDDPARSLLEGVEELGLSAGAQVVHGSTIATNALLERRGARTALITTRGFADVIEIGRQHRPDLYALVPRKPTPLVPREWRFELAERVSASGEVLVPLDPAEVRALLPRLQSEGIESVAVCFLFSYLRPGHERLVERELSELERARSTSSSSLSSTSYVSLSSEILPEHREYERTSTTVVNAYVAPLMDRYLRQLENGLAPRPLRIMQSNGGAISAQTARSQPARTALSGPAGGVVGAFEMARQALTSLPGFATPPPSPDEKRQERGPGGKVRLITFDMGGTSADVALCPGHIPLTSEGEIAGMPFRLPIIDIHTVGAGGGSLARVDSGGALVVGPESAGASPGPVCYGRGGSVPTVTDANLVLGRLDPAHFLGGRMKLDVNGAVAALKQLAGSLTLLPSRSATPPQERGSGGEAVTAAWGVVQVVNASMERAIRRVSVERGYDPRDFTLVAFGGAGPLHACELSDSLGIPRVLVPRAPGVLSALGMLLADVVKDYTVSVLRPASDLTEVDLTAILKPLEARAWREMTLEQARLENVRLEKSAELRYAGQSFEINVPLESGSMLATRAVFDRLHAERYGHSHPEEPVEVVNVRLRAAAPGPHLEFEPLPVGRDDPARAEVGRKPVWFGERGWLAARIYARERLMAGDRLDGPAVVFQLDATTLIPPGWTGLVASFGHLTLSGG